MSKAIQQLAVLMVFVLSLVSCKGTEAQGPQPYGTLTVNGAPVNGTVEIGNVRIYTLSGIVSTNRYLVRTTIAPGGSLSGSIYASFFDYKIGAGAVGQLTGKVDNTLYETFFDAASSGDYVVVLSGVPALDSLSQTSVNFYDLRLMSATGPALSTFQTPTVTATSAVATGSTSSHRINTYDGFKITPGGIYDVVLTSSTVTLSYPQMFIYGDNKLTVESLICSVTSATIPDMFKISDFRTGPTFSYFSTTATVSAVDFTKGIAGEPSILLKGVSNATYTIEVGP